MGTRPFARRLLGFAALPFISALSPFIVLPVVARAAGTDGWAAIGIGQSIGSLAAVVVIGGWSLYGPARLAGSPGRARPLYRHSLLGRMALLLAALPAVGCVVAALAPPRAVPLALLTAVAFASAGLSPAWFAIGSGRPAIIAKYEVVPRAAGALIAAGAVAMTGAIVVYPAVTLFTTMGGLVALHIAERMGRLRLSEAVHALRGLWSDRTAALAVIAGGVYGAVPVGVVGAFIAVDELARFTSADRLYRIGLLAVVALSSALQGWVAAPGPDPQRRLRQRRAVTAHAALGLSGALGIALLGAPISAVLFSGGLAADWRVLAFYGVSFLAVSVNTSTGAHLLMPLGRARPVLVSTLVGAGAGVGAMLVLTPIAGPVGGAAGLAIGEVLVCVVQVVALLRPSARRNAAGANSFERGAVLSMTAAGSG